MSSTDLCCESTCPPLPDGFVRLRYFFGKRLGVADLKDEQAYHKGKMRFHTRHLHGHGVVCGLGLSGFTGHDTDTVLRVGRGAAIDTCGREVVVPWDQCIDLAAWLTRRTEEAAATGETFPPESPFEICIVVRYRECPTTPEAAPRDPCACDTGGCEYGRMQESFELAVLTGEEAAPYKEPLPPSGPGLPCSESRNPDWVVLGCLLLSVDEHGALEPLPDASEWAGPPVVVHSTAWLQEQLAMGGALALETTGTTRALTIRFPSSPAAPSVQPGAFTLHRLDAKGWKAAGKFKAEARGTTVHIQPAKTFFQAEGRYRISTVHSATPLVDESLRPLRLERSFTLTDVDGALVLDVTSTS